MNKIPVLFSILVVSGFLALLSPSVMTALERKTTKDEIAIHQRDVDALVARKATLLSERDTAQTETERIKTLQAEENIKLERAKRALKTAEELRKSVVEEQMLFENIQRNLVATNQVFELNVASLRAELSKTRSDLSIVQANCESQKIQVASLRLEKESLEDRAVGLRTNIQMLQAQYDQVNKDIQIQKQDYAQNEEAGRKALGSLRKTEALLEQVTVDVAAKTKRNVSLEQEAGTFVQAVAGATKELSALKAQITKEMGALATVRAQLAVETETLKALQSDVDAARTAHVVYAAQAEQLKMDIAKLRLELSKSKDLVK